MSRSRPRDRLEEPPLRPLGAGGWAPPCTGPSPDVLPLQDERRPFLHVSRYTGGSLILEGITDSVPDGECGPQPVLSGGGRGRAGACGEGVAPPTLPGRAAWQRPNPPGGLAGGKRPRWAHCPAPGAGVWAVFRLGTGVLRADSGLVPVGTSESVRSILAGAALGG